MKQRIAVKDLEKLTDEQKRRLNELWTPALYDVVSAKVLKDITADAYDEYEFVIGGISLSGTSVYLADIAAFQNASPAIEEETMIPDSEVQVKVDPVFGESYPSFGVRDDFDTAMKNLEEPIEEEEETEIFDEEDLEDNYQRSAMLIKDDCLPLLTIGNMIEILQKNDYGKFDFYLTAYTYELGCELGRDTSVLGYNQEWQPAELCDVLWESVKELL